MRTVDLVSYLPPFIAEYKEIRDTLTAENPEFNLVWDATDRVLKNEFIATANEYGISRFEKLLEIYPSREDSLETRRARVQARWLSTLPYTWRKLIEKLISICGDNNFSIQKDFLFYRIHLEVSLGIPGQVGELERLINVMIPCNMTLTAKNTLPCIAEGKIGLASGVCAVETFLITNDWIMHGVSSGPAYGAGGVVNAETHFITNDGRESHLIPAHLLQAGGFANTVKVTITNDFNENFIIDGTAAQSGKTVIDEFIGANNIERDDVNGRIQ